MPSVKRIACVTNECVACGSCVKDCSKKAIFIHKGLRAIVNTDSCIGCGKCARICPADVIELQEVEIREEAVV